MPGPPDVWFLTFSIARWRHPGFSTVFALERSLGAESRTVQPGGVDIAVLHCENAWITLLPSAIGGRHVLAGVGLHGRRAGDMSCNPHRMHQRGARTRQ